MKSFSRTGVLVTAGLALLGAAFPLLSTTDAQAIDYIPGLRDKQDHYVGVPRLWPAGLYATATGKAGDTEAVPLLAGDDQPIHRLKITGMGLPAGSTIYWDYDERNWFVRIPIDKPIPSTNVFFHVRDRDGKSSQSGMLIVVYPRDNQPAPTPPEPTTEPAPPPVENRGPEVDFAGGTFRTGRRHVIPVTITDPEGDEVTNVYWRPYPGFKLNHVDGDRWQIVIDPTVKVGDYTLGIQAEDHRGKRGAELFQDVSITR